MGARSAESLISSPAAKALNFEKVHARGDVYVDDGIRFLSRNRRSEQAAALRIDERDPRRESRRLERDRQFPSHVRRDLVIGRAERSDGCRERRVEQANGTARDARSSAEPPAHDQ